MNLAQKIAASYGTSLGDIKVTVFSDGEFQPSFEETVRGQDVFLVQSTMPPTENIFELLLMIDAARRASARKIIAVIPYFGFARQDEGGYWIKVNCKYADGRWGGSRYYNGLTR